MKKFRYAALFCMCGIVFAPLGGYLSGCFGRRKSILSALPLVFTGWLMTALATDKIMLFLARGLMSSAIISIAPSIGTYISETVHPNLRPNPGTPGIRWTGRYQENFSDPLILQIEKCYIYLFEASGFM